MDFQKELEDLLNRCSMENGSDTPGFILAEYLAECLYTFDAAVRRRGQWYRHVDTPPKETGSEAT